MDPKQGLKDLDAECARMDKAKSRAKIKFDSALSDLLAAERALSMSLQKRMAFEGKYQDALGRSNLRD